MKIKSSYIHHCKSVYIPKKNILCFLSSLPGGFMEMKTTCVLPFQPNSVRILFWSFPSYMKRKTVGIKRQAFSIRINLCMNKSI